MISELSRLHLSLPDPPLPGGAYDSVNVRGNQAFVSIQFPILNGDFKFQGVLGKDLSTAEGYEAMELCALNVLAHINKKFSLNELEGVNQICGYYCSSSNWDEAPKILNGASDLLNNVLGAKGTHARSLVGVNSLPRNFSVGLVASLTLQRN